jgi:hypothetical protein
VLKSYSDNLKELRTRKDYAKISGLPKASPEAPLIAPVLLTMNNPFEVYLHINRWSARKGFGTVTFRDKESW